MSLTFKEILTAGAVPRETLHVPQLNGKVIIRGMSSAERDEMDMENAIHQQEHGYIDFKKWRARVVSKCLVDENDNLLVKNQADIDALAGVRGDAVEKMYELAAKLSGISKDDENAVKKKQGKLREAVGDALRSASA